MTISTFIHDTRSAARDAAILYFSPLWLVPRWIGRAFRAVETVERLQDDKDVHLVLHNDLRREMAMLSAANSRLTAEAHDIHSRELMKLREATDTQIEINRIFFELSAVTYEGLSARLLEISIQLQAATRSGVSDDQREDIMRKSNDALIEMRRALDAMSKKAKDASIGIRQIP